MQASGAITEATTALGPDELREIAPRYVSNKQRASRQAAIIDAIGPGLLATLAKHKIDAPLRIAHFLAQLCDESFGFSTTEEDPRLPQFPHFEQYEPDTECGRELGNRFPGDGALFKGRGLIQLTGRSNYQFYDRRLKLGIIAHPDQAANPETALVIACDYWNCRNLNTFADWDDVLSITHLINGGFNGLDQRRAYLRQAKLKLGLTAAVAPALPTLPLRGGDKGDAVRSLQTVLLHLQGDVGPDGEFGPGTESAVIRFQSAAGLDPDGVVGQETWAALQRAVAG